MNFINLLGSFQCRDFLLHLCWLISRTEIEVSDTYPCHLKLELLFPLKGMINSSEKKGEEMK